MPEATVHQKRTFPWISLIVLLTICLLIFLIIRSYVLESRMADNERHGRAAIVVVGQAESDLRNHDYDENGVQDYWVADIRSLHYIRGRDGNLIRLISKNIADADATKGTGEPLHGYLLATIPLDGEGKPYNDGTGHNASKFAFCAYPLIYGATGNLTYIICEDMEVRRKDTRGVPVTKWPSHEESEGWSGLMH